MRQFPPRDYRPASLPTTAPRRAPFVNNCGQRKSGFDSFFHIHSFFKFYLHFVCPTARRAVLAAWAAFPLDTSLPLGRYSEIPLRSASPRAPEGGFVRSRHTLAFRASCRQDGQLTTVTGSAKFASRGESLLLGFRRNRRAPYRDSPFRSVAERPFQQVFGQEYY